MISEVAIQGDGISAACCVKLLALRNVGVSLHPARDRAALRPTLLINPQTQKLLADVFEGEDALFTEAQPIRRRVVLWGDAPEPQSFPHSGFSIPESALLERLWRSVHGNVPVSNTAEWQIHSSSPVRETERRQFGSRMATAVTVRLRIPDNDACWVESLDEGWLFLVPTGGGQGSLIAVGENPATMVEQSRLIGAQTAEPTGEGVKFAACPRICFPLCAPGWLACGTAAMAFDPICGEGAGHAVREAILAAATLGTIHHGADPEAALGQYKSRLLGGFLRHLEICKQFYATGGQSKWWHSEVAALDCGLQWTRAQLAAAPSPSSRLVGFDLQPIRHS